MEEQEKAPGAPLALARPAPLSVLDTTPDLERGRTRAPGPCSPPAEPETAQVAETHNLPPPPFPTYFCR